MATLSGVSAACRRTASPRDCIDDVAELMIDASTVFPSPLSLERPLLSPHVEATANDAIGRMVTIGYSKLNWRSKWRPARSTMPNVHLLELVALGYMLAMMIKAAEEKITAGESSEFL